MDENGITMKAKDNTDMTPEEKTGEILPCEQPSDCLICGNEGPVLLYGHWRCNHCKNGVQAEALAQRAGSSRKTEGLVAEGFRAGGRMISLL